MNAIHATRAARSPFDPPGPGGLGPPLALALAAHLLLALALTWGLRWNSQPQNLAVQAELWSPVVQQAAPRPIPVEPPPVEQPAPTPPTPAPPPQPTADEQREAEIALQQEKQRQAEQQRQMALERQRKERELAQERQRQQELAAQKAAEEAKRKEQLAKAEAAKKAEADKRAEVARRMDALRRMTALASADDGAGQDARDAGPSGDYAARIRTLVRQAINFPPGTPGNPTVIVEVRTGPTGEIISKRIITPSGVKAWDEAVLRAFDRIQKLPSDKGRYWNPMEVKVNLVE